MGFGPRAFGRKEKEPLWELVRAGTQGLMMFPGIWLVSEVCLFFLCFPHLFVPSDFPCDFYSWMLCDNFPFHQPTWLLCSFSSSDIYYCSYFQKIQCHTWYGAWWEWSHTTECLCSLHQGTYTSSLSLYFARAKLIPFFFYLNQMYYSQHLIWDVS